MLFAGCKTDVRKSLVLNFAHTHMLIDDINNLVSAEIQHINASDPVISHACELLPVEAVFFEVHALEVTNDTIELIRKIRQTNKIACIFIFITHSKSFSNLNYYIAGADHCIKLPNNQLEKRNLLSRTLEDSHWKSPIQLYLDCTRLLLCSVTRKLEITYTEMTIIDALIQAPEHLMSQDSIAKTLDPNIIFYDPRALEKTISRLRTKIKKTYNTDLIISVRAYGYRLRRGTVSR